MKPIYIWVNPLTPNQRHQKRPHRYGPWSRGIVNGVSVWMRMVLPMGVFHVVPIYENYEWLVTP